MEQATSVFDEQLKFWQSKCEILEQQKNSLNKHHRYTSSNVEERLCSHKCKNLHYEAYAHTNAIMWKIAFEELRALTNKKDRQAPGPTLTYNLTESFPPTFINNTNNTFPKQVSD